MQLMSRSEITFLHQLNIRMEEKKQGNVNQFSD
jgi:hypothetical protein